MHGPAMLCAAPALHLVSFCVIHLVHSSVARAWHRLQFPASEHKQARRVVRECRIAASTSHPNCVSTHSHFTISVCRKLAHTNAAG